MRDRSQDSRQHGNRRNRQRLDAQLLQRRDRDWDQNQDEHQGADRGADASRARRLGQAGLLKPAIRVGGLQCSLDDSLGQSRDYKPNEEDQDRAEDARNEGRDLREQ